MIFKIIRYWQNYKSKRDVQELKNTFGKQRRDLEKQIAKKIILDRDKYYKIWKKEYNNQNHSLLFEKFSFIFQPTYL